MDKKLKALIDSYDIEDTNLFNVRNKNEKRVIEAIKNIMLEYPAFLPNDLDLQDIYALALNKLPPRYTQRGTIVLGEPVRKDEVADAVRDAVETVWDRPNYDR